ncbi:hypothetical protein GMOD_00002083 [Pyrenophora seminiperda CCB06]|uniref:Uncharacterized protein n=1 Tax=Pyrenophora seminiperda CCB06 TaxID=1302712 RepID=A0A3M7LWX9_9PLEO|nr:hypothetical protein GMOD_00002083 [Pyrenophora seminiperda CCB06]
MVHFPRRLRHPLRRPTHFCIINEPPLTPRQLEEQRERNRQRALDEIENAIDDGRNRPRRPNSPDELPVIIDRGPYKGVVYPKEELYYNSIMLASDVEPIYASPLGSHLRQEVHRTPFRQPKATDGENPTPRPVPDEHLTVSQNAENLRLWEERNDKNVGNRPVENPTTMRFQSPRHPLSVPRAPSPPRGPIVHGSQEWDTFMDFPSENSMHIYRDQDGDRPANPDTTFTTTAPPEEVAVSEIRAPTDQEETQFYPSAQETPLPVQAQDWPPNNPPVIPSSESEVPEVLTWNIALNRILNHEAVDPEMRAAVWERAQRSSTTNGSGHMDNHPVSAIDVGLVPNFSRPIMGSAFYDRMTDEQVPATQPAEHCEVQYRHGLLPNGVGSRHHHHRNPDDYVTIERPLAIRGSQEFHHGQLPNGIPPSYYPPSSSSTSSSFGQRQSLPPDPVPYLVSDLLYTLLTSSELDLHQEIVGGSTPMPSPALTQPPSNAASAVPLHDRLLEKMHSTVYGLQDRVTGLEEDLIPNMTAWLEQKELRIDQLSVKLANLREDIAALKKTVDFGTKLLNKCWEREWELWRTLLDIQKQRQANRSALSRIFSRKKPTVAPDMMQLLGDSIPKGYVSRISSVDTAMGRRFKTEELDAVLLAAQQNVTILKEDMEDMAELVKAYQARTEALEETVPVILSWRDI